MDILEVIYKASQGGRVAGELTGRVLGLQLGICYDTSDPLQLGRIRVLEPSKGAKTYSDWLYRYQPFSNLSTPVPTPGSTVVYMYVDGDPHEGLYLGVIHNKLNPVTSEEFKLNVGNVSIEITGSTLNISGVTDVTINDKSISVVGAKDTRGDTLVTKGW